MFPSRSNDIFTDPQQEIGTTSTSLIRRLKLSQRDEAAWKRLVELYGRLVLSWCRKAGVKQNDRQDVFQDIFSAVNRKIHDFQWGNAEQTFRGWLRVIATSKINDKHRKNKTLPQTFSDTHFDDILGKMVVKESDIDHDTERTILMRRAVEIVKPDFAEKTWEAFKRTEIDGQTATETAVELDMTPAAVRQAKKRVLDRIRSEFEGLID